MKTTAWNKRAEANIQSTIGGDGSAAHEQCSLFETEKDWAFLYQVCSFHGDTSLNLKAKNIYAESASPLSLVVTTILLQFISPIL